MDHGLDCGLDYGPNCWAPIHAFRYLGFRHVHVWFCITGKLALPCQHVHRPFEFLLAQYANVFLGMALLYDYEAARVTSLESRISVICCPQRRADYQCGLTLHMSYSDDRSEAYKHC